jgi:hypothetical protein
MDPLRGPSAARIGRDHDTRAGVASTTGFRRLELLPGNRNRQARDHRRAARAVAARRDPASLSPRAPRRSSTAVCDLRPAVDTRCAALRLHEPRLDNNRHRRDARTGAHMLRDTFVAFTSDQLDRVVGGMAGPMWAAMQKANELGLQVQGVITGNHAVNSRHWRGRGMDIGGSEANLWKFVEWAKGTNYHEVIYKNQFFKDGRRVPGIGNHDDHVHYSF